MTTPEEITTVFHDEINMHRIPADWINFIGCCACSCSYCDYPSCSGSKSNYHHFCCRGEQLCCKVVEEDKNACCMLSNGMQEFVYCTLTYKCYSQWYCFEIFMDCCSTVGPDTKFYKNPNKRIPTENTDPDLSKTYVAQGSCCATSSYNCDCDNNYQCYSKGECCICQNDSVSCKPTCNRKNYGKDDVWCLYYKGNYACGFYPTCCKSISQLWCIDSRCGIPCSNESPFICTICPFLVCLPKFGCCVTLDSFVIRPMQNHAETNAPMPAVVATPIN